MNEVIDFFFYLTSQGWALIRSKWVLNICLILGVFNLVITLVNKTQGNE